MSDCCGESSPRAGTQGCWGVHLFWDRHNFALSKSSCRIGSGLVLRHPSGCQKVCAENHSHRRKSQHLYLGLWTPSCQAATSLSRAGFVGSSGRSSSLSSQQGINCLWQVSLKDRKTTKEHSLCLLAGERITTCPAPALIRPQDLLCTHRDRRSAKLCFGSQPS